MNKIKQEKYRLEKGNVQLIIKHTVNSRRLLGYRMSHSDESVAAEGPRASTEGG